MTITETPTPSPYPIPNEAKIITAANPFIELATTFPFQVMFTQDENLAVDDDDVLVINDTQVTVPVFNPQGYSVHADMILSTIRARLPRRFRDVTLDRVPVNLLNWASTFWVEVKQDQNRIIILDPLKCTDALPTWTPNENPVVVP